MSVRFQADADLDARIIRGPRRREPAIDFQTAEETRLVGLPDPQVLRITAELNRILVSHDEGTMPAHFARFVVSQSSPGVIIVPQETSLGSAIEDLLLIWAASEADEWRDRIVWLPL